MTTAKYNSKDLTVTLGGVSFAASRGSGFGEPYTLSSRAEVIEHMGIVSPPEPAGLTATGHFKISRAGLRILVALAQGRRHRRSRGWRRHVRRMKAAERRGSKA